MVWEPFEAGPDSFNAALEKRTSLNAKDSEFQCFWKSSNPNQSMAVHIAATKATQNLVFQAILVRYLANNIPRRHIAGYEPYIPKIDRTRTGNGMLY